jgi:hypothetical protein
LRREIHPNLAILLKPGYEKAFTEVIIYMMPEYIDLVILANWKMIGGKKCAS